MPGNIEIKAALSNEQFEKIRERARKRSKRPSELLEQTDTFYRALIGRLKLREFADGSAELIAYDRPDQSGPKHSSYVRCPADTPAAMHEALTRSLGIRGVVRKRREVIHIGSTRVHLDEVEGLGSFLELEVVLEDGPSHAEGEAVARELMALFGVEPERLIKGAYIDLLEQR